MNKSRGSTFSVIGITVLFTLAGLVLVRSLDPKNPFQSDSVLRRSAGIAFGTDTQAAMKLAARQHKLVMVDVFTDWCVWCKKLDKDVYSRTDVAKAVAKDFVPLKINPEKDAASGEFATRHRVEGLPTILFLDAKGKEVHRIDGYADAPQFLRELNTARENGRKSAHRP